VRLCRGFPGALERRVGTVRAGYVGGWCSMLRTESAFVTVGGRSDCSDEKLALP
jgi:hypothetical protein